MGRFVAAVLCGVFFTIGAAGAADWSNADGSCYGKGQKNFGIAVDPFPLGGHVVFDYAFHDAISGGAAAGFVTYFSSFEVPITLRASFHPFNLAVLADKIKVRDKLDAYIGLTGGVGFPFTWYVREHIGARWYFNPKFYGFVEEGAGYGWINGGIGWKF